MLEIMPKIIPTCLKQMHSSVPSWTVVGAWHTSPSTAEHFFGAGLVWGVIQDVKDT